MQIRAFCLVVTSIFCLQGCAVLLVGSAGAVAAKTATDRRTVGTQIDDTTSSSSVSLRWGRNEALTESANLQANVYNGVLLITGQAPTQALIDQAEEIAKTVPHITKVHNQVRLGHPIDASTQANDLWIDSKVKAKLLTDKTVPTTQVKVVVENSEVFLMGKLSSLEATRAIELTRNVSGVKRVIRALELI